MCRTSPVDPENSVSAETIDFSRIVRKKPKSMLDLIKSRLLTGSSLLKTQRELALENLALRQQLTVLSRSAKRPKLTITDRSFWVALKKIWPQWSDALVIVKPSTVVVSTATFRILFVFFLISHDRRKVLHFNVTNSPSAEWTAQQVVNAFPYDSAPRFLLRDQDRIYGSEFRDRMKAMGIEEITTARRSPWQNLYADRAIGSFRRECLDHCIIINEAHLIRIFREYIDSYYNPRRMHIGLGKDCPISRVVEPPENGAVISLPILGGLHHHYSRKAA